MTLQQLVEVVKNYDAIQSDNTKSVSDYVASEVKLEEAISSLSDEDKEMLKTLACASVSEYLF